MTVCNIIIIAKIKDTIDIHTPSNIEIFNGAVVKETNPSIAYENNFLKLHFVFPFVLLTFSISIYFTSNPTQLKIPFENLLYSFNCSIELTTCLVIILKS